MTTLKTPNRDAQGRCDELLSPTHILPVEQPRLDNNIQQQSTTKKKKKKCRGNRKEQHKRRRLRHAQQQQMNNNTNYDDADNHGSQYEQIQV